MIKLCQTLQFPATVVANSTRSRTFTARVASGLRGGNIEVRVDSVNGKTLCKLDLRVLLMQELQSMRC